MIEEPPTEAASAAPAGATPDAATRRWLVIAGVALSLVVAVCAGLLIGSRTAGNAPSSDSVDAGFARDMQIHHTQAVEMSYAVTLAADDQEVRLIAFDILTSQQAQIGRMSGWLDEWDLPAYSSAPLMAWMPDGGHEGHDMAEMDDGALMPGMTTDTELRQLEQSSREDAGILYLQLMIDHHRGGVEMASYAAEHAEDEQVRLSAHRMASSQALEIDAMNDMLVDRGVDPL